MLHCLDKNTGSVIWARDLREDFSASHMMYGYGASALAAVALGATRPRWTFKASLLAALVFVQVVAYTFAYLAILRSGRALMILKGLRPADGRQHKTVVEVAGHFLGKEFEDLTLFETR